MIETIMDEKMEEQTDDEEITERITMDEKIITETEEIVEMVETITDEKMEAEMDEEGISRFLPKPIVMATE